VDRVARLAEDLPRPSPRAGQQGAEPPTADEPTLSWSSAPTNADLELPLSFGDYELRSEIGKGGMGKVYRAYKKSLAVVVALKMIRAGRFASPEEMRLFLKEARAHANLDHPHIVRVYDGGEVAGQLYFTMKLVEGGDMGKHLPRLAKDLKGTVQLLAKVARAVHHAHERGILHRDLKPGNILLEGKPDTPVAQLVPLVSDFGLAKRIQPDPTNSQTKTADDAGYVAPEQVRPEGGLPDTVQHINGLRHSGPVGTPGFMPPEQAAPESGKLTTAADVYSLGAILYKLLTGRPPFLGKTKAETLTLVRTRTPELPRKLKPAVNRDLEAVCLKCLEKQPERRYRSALELAEELERWGRNEPVLARRRPWPARVWRAARRNSLLCTVMLLAGIAAGGGFMEYYWTNPERPRWAIERRLSRGEAVILIGETGPPRWLRSLPSDDMILASRAPEKPFSFNSLNVGRLELVPTVPVLGYRFSAKVRHDQVIADEGGLADGETGIYFAYTTHDQESCWCELTFADLGIRAYPRGTPLHPFKTSTVALRLLHRTHGPEAESEFDQQVLINRVNKPFQPEPDKWRSLALEVWPEVVRAFWGEGDQAVLIGEISCAELQQLGANRIKPRDKQSPKPVFTFAPQGGLGLFISKGSASFQNVVVEPLN
jgi:serine/threonine-protein kinase